MSDKTLVSPFINLIDVCYAAFGVEYHDHDSSPIKSHLASFGEDPFEKFTAWTVCSNFYQLCFNVAKLFYVFIINCADNMDVVF